MRYDGRERTMRDGCTCLGLRLRTMIYNPPTTNDAGLVRLLCKVPRPSHFGDNTGMLYFPVPAALRDLSPTIRLQM